MELWQFVAVGSMLVSLWLFLDYVPRRPGEGGEDRSTETKEPDDGHP